MFIYTNVDHLSFWSLVILSLLVFFNFRKVRKTKWKLLSCYRVPKPAIPFMACSSLSSSPLHSPLQLVGMHLECTLSTQQRVTCQIVTFLFIPFNTFFDFWPALLICPCPLIKLSILTACLLQKHNFDYHHIISKVCLYPTCLTLSHAFSFFFDLCHLYQPEIY